MATLPWYFAALLPVGVLRCLNTCCRCLATALIVFVPFATVYMNQPFKMDYVWVGLCMVGAVYFIFRSG